MNKYFLCHNILDKIFLKIKHKMINLYNTILKSTIKIINFINKKYIENLIIKI